MTKTYNIDKTRFLELIKEDPNPETLFKLIVERMRSTNPAEAETLKEAQAIAETLGLRLGLEKTKQQGNSDTHRPMSASESGLISQLRGLAGK